MPTFADVLDNLAELKKCDPKDMLADAVRIPDAVTEAIRGFETSGFIPLQGGVKNVIVCGMGDSAMAGDLLRCVAAESGVVPVEVIRDFDIPAYADNQTWAIFVSYSGNTEEMLSAYKAARTKRCTRLCITTGGRLAELAAMDRVPVIQIPGGHLPPTEFFHLLIPLLLAAARSRIVSVNSSAFATELQKQWQRFGPSVPFADNPAKQVAAAIYGRLPIFYAAGGYRSAVAFRWRTQINANAKLLAVENSLPDVCHNETVGWRLAGRQSRNFAVVFLTDGTETPEMQAKMQAVRTAVGETPAHEARIEGPTVPTRMLSMCYMSDFVSLYLARLNEIDPSHDAVAPSHAVVRTEGGVPRV